jgi:hypothetical protein
MLLGLLTTLVFSDIVRINTYYPMPIGAESFAVDSENIGYFLDAKAKQIRIFDPLGNQIDQFGQPGQGVGDLDTPRRMYLEGERIVVVEDNYINVFKKNGEFVSKDRTPLTGLAFTHKFRGTLLAYASKFKNPKQLKLQFFTLQNEPFDETISFDWEHPLSRAGSDPSMSAINIVPSPQNNFVYIVFSKEFRLVMIDIEERKVVNDIRIEAKAIPFNETWGDAEFEKNTELWQQIERRMGFEPSGKPYKPRAFPSNFPIIRKAYSDLQGNVVVSLWTKNPDKIFDLRAFSPQGDTVAVEFDHPDTYRRLIARRNGYVYLWDYDIENEESSIVRVKKQQVNEFAQQNPLTFELVGQNLPPRN